MSSEINFHSVVIYRMNDALSTNDRFPNVLIDSVQQLLYSAASCMYFFIFGFRCHHNFLDSHIYIRQVRVTDLRTKNPHLICELQTME